jgi:uncharacterized protein
LKVVLDTNIWISGLLLPKSKAGKIIAAWELSKVEIVTSQAILDEIKKVLLYPKIHKRIHWDEAQIDQYILFLKFFSHFVVTKKIKSHAIVERDPADSIILNTLIASYADYLVTRDNDLLVMKENYPIITLAEFCEIVL